MTLDVRAFWLIGSLVSLSCGLLVVIVRKTYPDYLGRALAVFGGANLCLAASYAIRLQRPWIGDFFFDVIATTLNMVCLSMEYAAISLLKRQQPQKVWTLGPSAAVFVGCLWFTFVTRNISFELVLTNIFTVALAVRIVCSLAQKEEDRRPFPDVVAAMAYAGFGAAILAVLADALQRWHFSPEYDFNRGRAIFYNIVAILSVGITFPLILLILSERLNRALTVQAMRDPLTGIYNRRAFEEIAFRELSGATRSGASLSLLIVDLDHFKQINDQHGHLAGDALLQAVSSILRGSLRDEDFLCRWGGDEFCALLPRASRTQAETVAKRVLQAFDEFRLLYGETVVRIGGSIGIATDEGHATTLSALVSSADSGLYRAKLAGRNAFAFAPDDNEESSSALLEAPPP